MIFVTAALGFGTGILVISDIMGSTSSEIHGDQYQEKTFP